MSEPPGPARQLELVRSEMRAEIGFLHDRVNALVAAEAFLTIAYTTAMANAAPWGTVFAAVVSPVLAALGLALALLSWPGVRATVRLVLALTRQQELLVERDPESAAGAVPLLGASFPARRAWVEQRRSTLFFRAVPPLFAAVWSVLLVVALVLVR